MHVRLFHTLNVDGRTSMEVYARELGAALRAVNSEDTISDHVPRQPLTDRAPGRLRRMAAHLDHYVLYQLDVGTRGADVNHVVDHGYAHLAWCLDPDRTVVTFHDAMLLRLAAGELNSEFRPRRSIAIQQLNLRALRDVAWVVTDSEASRVDLLRFAGCDPARVSVIPLGVGPHFFHAAARPISQRNGVRILHVGHSGFYKNIEAIIQAIRPLQRRIGDRVTFVKAGECFTSAQLDLIDRLGVSDAVEHLGRVPDEQLPSVYAAADVLVMPSRLEGFGLPVLEAMAAGTPVVASRAGSLPEVVGDAGVLLERDHPEAIAQAVDAIIRDAALQKELVARGGVRAAQFSWANTARRMFEVYRGVGAGGAA